MQRVGLSRHAKLSVHTLESSSTSAATARRPYGFLPTSGTIVTALWLPAASRNGEGVIEFNSLTCAPTATRTRDLLLRRHFRSVPVRCYTWPDVPFGRGANGWMRPGVALTLWSLAPRLAPRNHVSNANVRIARKPALASPAGSRRREQPGPAVRGPRQSDGPIAARLLGKNQGT